MKTDKRKRKSKLKGLHSPETRRAFKREREMLGFMPSALPHQPRTNHRLVK